MSDPNEISDEESPNYTPPPEKPLQQILDADKEDESLQKYKQALLGQVAAEGAVIVDPNDPRRVIVKALTLLVAGRDDVVLDLSGESDSLIVVPS